MSLILTPRSSGSNTQLDNAMSMDMRVMLEQPPVKLTRLEDWVVVHAKAFAVSAGSVG
jgi:hypothetical protein